MKGDSIIRPLCLGVPFGNTEDHGSQPHSTGLQAKWKNTTLVLLHKVQTNVISSPNSVPWAPLTVLCQRTSGQQDSGPCKHPSSVPQRHLEMHSMKPLCLSQHRSILRHKALRYQGASPVLSSLKYAEPSLSGYASRNTAWSCFSFSAVGRADL